MNSYMWVTKWFLQAKAELVELQLFREVCFQSCMHGGARDKKCKLWHALIDLSSLELWCDKRHVHLPWG
eukprot:9508448-Karenia_brevis.AAC.1